MSNLEISQIEHTDLTSEIVSMLKNIPQFHTLANGIRIVSFPMPSTETISVLILVKVGSRDEKAGVQGVSHFLEHLFFKGSEKRPSAEEISHLLDSIGAHFNAFTTKEFTGFYITSSYDKLELVLDILADVLIHPLFAIDEIERERGVILEEMRLFYDTPSRYIGDVFEDLLWQNHPLGRDIIGTSETLAAMTPDDITSYFRDHYHAPQTVISVAGKFENTHLYGLLERFFAPFDKGTDNHGYPATLPPSHSRSVLVREKTSDQAHVALGVLSFGLFDKRREAAEILATLLGGGMSSRLFLRVRERLGLAYYVSSVSEHYADTGYLASYAGVNVTKIDLAIKAMKEEYERIAKEPIGMRELTKAKECIKGQLLIELESSFAMARLIGFKELILKEREPLEAYFARLEAITEKDISELAASLFTKGDIKLAVIGPYKDEARFAPLL